MSAISITPGLRSLAPNYQVLVCDIWGVIHNGRAAFDGVVDCLKAFRSNHGTVLLLSNAPRPSGPIREQLLLARTSQPPSEAHLEAWQDRVGDPKAQDDLWLVGGERAMKLATTVKASAVKVDDVLELNARKLQAEVRPLSRPCAAAMSLSRSSAARAS